MPQVRIKRAGPQPTPQNKTGDQVNYGLITRPPLFGTGSMTADNPYSAGGGMPTIQKVDRDEATLIAEKGESVVGDLAGNQQLSHARIAGKTHSAGGTPLDVTPGSFVFSNTKKLRIKDDAVLDHFNKKPSKAGFTPAEIAKQYPIDKYLNALSGKTDQELDPIQAETYQRMLETNQQKLAELALMQESMKGFPKGIPQISQQLLGMDSSGQPAETEQPVMQHGGSVPLFRRAGEVDPPNKRRTNSDQIFADELEQSGYGTRARASNLAHPFPVLPMNLSSVINRTVNSVPVGTQVPVSATSEAAQTPVSMPTAGLPPDAPEPRTPFWQQDKLDIAGSVLDYANLKKYLPTLQQIPLHTGEFTPLDSAGAIAQINSQYNQTASQLDSSADPTVARANRLGLAGKAMEQIAGVQSQYDNANAQGAAQFSQQTAQMRNQNEAQNAELLARFMDQTTVANQQFDNSKREAMDRMRQRLKRGITNAQETEMVGDIYGRNFGINPQTGRLEFKGGEGIDDMGISGSTGESGSGGFLSADQTADYAKNLYDKYIAKGVKEDLANKMVQQQVSELGRRQSQAAQQLYRHPQQYGMPPMMNPMQMLDFDN